MQVSLNDECIGTLSFRSEKWTEAALVIPVSCTHAALQLTVTEGGLDILSLRFSPGGGGKWRKRCSEQITERIQEASFILSCRNNKRTPDS